MNLDGVSESDADPSFLLSPSSDETEVEAATQPPTSQLTFV